MKAKILILLSFILVISILAGILIGTVNATVFDLIKYMQGKKDVLGFIIFNVRMPRTFAAAIGGASLAVSGLLLQTYFRNPLAGPYVLGISSAASLGVAFYMLAGIAFAPGVVASALAGSAFAIVLIISIAAKVRSAVTLLIVGLMLGYIFSAIDQVLITFANAKKVQIYIMWTFGSFSGVTWSYLKMMGIISIPFLIITLLMSKPLNAMLLGEEYAKTMGVNVKAVRVVVMAISAIFAAVVTAYCGIVAFIGLAVPHMAKLMLKSSDHRLLIPSTALLGASVTVICDILARMLLAPVELPISVITSMFGAPVVIYLVVKRNVR